jgi:hypothetical protein
VAVIAQSIRRFGVVLQGKDFGGSRKSALA